MRKEHGDYVREYAYEACVEKMLGSAVKKRHLIDAIITLRERLGIFVENPAVHDIPEHYKKC